MDKLSILSVLPRPGLQLDRLIGAHGKEDLDSRY
jgi:hypothetical protein